MKTNRTALAGAAVVAGAVLATTMSPGGAAAPRPQAVPVTGFEAPRPNPYFPIQPGSVSVLKGHADGHRLVDRFTVTDRTKVIQGVTTTVIRDVLRRTDGTIAEKTHDWYADDNDGNVWYFGEDTATYDRKGHVTSREGSWEAGVDGAVRGVIMPADPKPTNAYRQEFLAGHAEDQAWIVENDFTTTVPYGRLDHVVRSFEWSRLERRVMSVKYYAPGLGVVREQDIAGGDELFRLVSFTHR